MYFAFRKEHAGKKTKTDILQKREYLPCCRSNTLDHELLWPSNNDQRRFGTSAIEEGEREGEREREEKWLKEKKARRKEKENKKEKNKMERYGPAVK